eukprot:CAMPEP_0201497650 /NCGR_PEP_ID=MMETSP0151_2-20130828/67022_1 /ASSEMBLY_ACC=CAM_ASM_000257 /TAXON_ID=200890 /ORGANISM="Paramoeba atlantica, Strain 621/1 / CCAP 1560/9" /LENGTH=62 /DNA_ID=CAMNT_0047888581 /DNA_START=152 /DNA_END=337 /DNA_ORIENTATION=+
MTTNSEMKWLREKGKIGEYGGMENLQKTEERTQKGDIEDGRNIQAPHNELERDMVKERVRLA